MIVCAVFRYIWPNFTFAEDSMYGIPQDVINYRINGAGKRNGMEWNEKCDFYNCLHNAMNQITIIDTVNS